MQVTTYWPCLSSFWVWNSRTNSYWFKHTRAGTDHAYRALVSQKVAEVSALNQPEQEIPRRLRVICPIVAAILLHLDLPHTPPPLSPARGPPQTDLLTGLLDQTPAFDLAEPDPVPDFEFDQSLPDDLEP